jgi:hypothetical protein
MDFDNLQHREILRIAARQHFWAFCCYFDFEFFAIKRRFLKEVAMSMQNVVDEYEKGNAIKISVSMPPRAGKSYITSLFAAYWLCRFPALSVMRNTCTGTLYDKFSYDTRALFRTTKIKEIFPEIELQPDKQNVSGWNLTTSKQVGYFGAGVGGSIIGFGANLAITDDLYKSMLDALSTTVQSTTKSWKQSAHDSRKEKNCPEIFIGTRWTKNDIIGEAIDSGDLTSTLIIPALINDKSFCEDVKSTDEYLKIKSDIEPSIWGAEYMQQPAEAEGLLLPIGSLRFDDLSQIKPHQATYRFSVGDPADKGGDKYAMPFIYVDFSGKQMTCYVKDCICNEAGIMANTGLIINKLNEYCIDECIVEANGVGLASVIQLKEKIIGSTKLIPFNSTEQKEARILSNYEWIQKYFVFDSNYKSNPQYYQFMKDLTGYYMKGDNKHRMDAIDVLCSAAKVLKVKFGSIVY